MKLSKIALATAAFAAIASGSVFAGQIASGTTAYAKEVIFPSTLTLVAPSKVYTFQGDINATTNPQKLQLGYKLTNGLTWNAVGSTIVVSGATPGAPTVVTAGVVNPGTGTPTAGQFNGLDIINLAYTDGNGVARSGFPVNTQISTFLSADSTTLYFNITIPAVANALNNIRGAQFTVNGGLAVGATTNAGLANLFPAEGANPTAATPSASTLMIAPTNTAALLGTSPNAPSCVRAPIAYGMEVIHATSHNGTTELITPGVDSESVRTGNNSRGGYLELTQALKWTITPTTQASNSNAVTINTTLVSPTAYGTLAANLSGGYSNYTVPAAWPTGNNLVSPVTRHHVGSITLSHNNLQSGDLNPVAAPATNFYGVGLGVTTVPLEAADFGFGATGAGRVDLAAFGARLATVTALKDFPIGTQLFVVQRTTGIVVGSSTALAAAGKVLNAVTIAAFNGAVAATAGGLDVFVQYPGGTGRTIAQDNVFQLESLLAKDKTAALGDQDNNCYANTPGIGSGIKIDIRNYASTTKFPPGPATFASFVRLINNSETQTADVFAQMIYADGKYGPSGVLPSLLPRAVMNLSNVQLEAFMTTPAPVNNPFGTAAAYTSDQTASPTYVGSNVLNVQAANTTGDRVRFVSTTGTTLRVQSFMLLPSGNLLDTTSAQGVDFENTTNNRAPEKDAMPISQDAINGLAR